jgi:hypothetical protein
MSLFRASDPAADADWSVPTPRGPYPVTPSYPDPSAPDPDAPTQRLYRPIDEPEPLSEPDDANPYELLPQTRRPHRSRGVLLALAIAVLALLASGGASYIAWSAKGRAETVPHAPAVIPSTVADSSGPAPAAAMPEPAPSGYTLRYAQEPLQVRVDCDEAALVDLDEPRLDAPEPESDIRYDNRCGAGGPLLSIGPGGRAGSHISDPEADAPGCADAIDTDPLDSGDTVPVQKGTVLCVRTGGAAGSQPLLALVEVTGLGANGVASLRATAWIPPATPADAGPSDPAAVDQTPDDTAPAVPDDDVPSEEAYPGD